MEIASRTELLESMDRLAYINQDKKLALETQAKIQGQFVCTPWLNYILRKSFYGENAYFRNTRNQSPQYRIVYMMNEIYRPLPIFLTKSEEKSLKVDFENVILFCSNSSPTENEVEIYSMMLEDIFNQAIKYDDVPNDSPYKYYTYQGVFLNKDEATPKEIDLFKKEQASIFEANKRRIKNPKPKDNLCKRVISYVYDFLRS